MLKLNLMSVFVNNPYEALEFYTSKLGFVKKTIHDSINYITVGTEDGALELLLETSIHDLAKQYQKGVYKLGIPAATLYTENLDKEYEHLLALGIKFIRKPSDISGSRLAVFDDERGNLIQIVES